MEILILVLLEIVRAFIREVVAYFIKVFADKRKNEKTTPKLRQSKKGGRSRK